MVQRYILIILAFGILLLLPFGAQAGLGGLGPPHIDPSNPWDACQDCHSFGSPWGWNPQGIEQEALCKSCHNPSGQASSMSVVGNHLVNDDSMIVDCGSCHDPHGSHTSTDPHSGETLPNLSLIRTNTAEYISGALEPAVFQLKPAHYAFDENNSPWNGICQTCHTQTGHHTKDGAADHSHRMEFNCTACHLHEDGFAPSGGNCLECHNQPQGSRRQIVGPGGDFDQASKHISGTITKDNCKACHDLTRHTLGKVRMKDPDSGASWAGTTTDFCLTCHDGNPPPGVTFPGTTNGTGYDKSSFLSSTHDQQMGTAGCIHCHSAHGSPNVSMLKDNFVKTDYNQWSNGDGDYAACWQCHGESSTVTGNNNAFEDLHDKHVRGEDSPCYICHDVHASADSLETGLINFENPIQQGYDISYTNGSNAASAYYKIGSVGNCMINCHGKNHTPKDYRASPNPATDCSSCHSPGSGFSHDPEPFNCAYCHESSRPVEPHPQGADCSLCHFDPGVTWLGATFDHSPAPVSCTSCHANSRPATPHEQVLDCVSCHINPGVSWLDVQYDHIPTPVSCAACHADNRPAAPHNQTMDCVACHNDPGGSWPGSGQSYDHNPPPATCADCHEPNRPSTNHISSGECAMCHDQPGVTFQGATGGDCVTCHNQPQGARAQIVGPGGEFEQTSTHWPGTIQSSDCLLCHYVGNHSQGTVERINPEDNTQWLGTYADFCMICHDGNPPDSISFPATTTGTGYDKSAFQGTAHADGLRQRGCGHCHASHGSQYIDLLKNNYVVTDNNRWTNGDGDYATCWTCHDETSTVTGNNAFEDLHDEHVRGEDAPCFICHDVHSPFNSSESGLINFEAPIGNNYDISYRGGGNAETSFWFNGNTGYCAINCHGKDHRPKDYSRNPDSNPRDCTACHDPNNFHSPLPADCGSCHAANRPPPPHNQNQDCIACHIDPGGAWLNISAWDHQPPPNYCALCHESTRPLLPHVQGADCALCHTDPGGAWIGTGDYTHDPIPQFCGGCHAQTRPAVPHIQAGDCSQCHQNVGVTWIGTTAGPCDSCHNQIQGTRPQIMGPGGEFDLASKHRLSPQTNEDCVMCHYVKEHQGGTVHMSNPYSSAPQVWPGADTDFCLTCHGDAPPAGITFPSTSNGTGYSKSYYWDSTHNLNLGTRGCWHCHENHGSQYVSLLRNKYVKADNNRWSQGDGDYAACWQCHIENEVVLQDNAFKDLHDKHVRSEDSPCFICHDVHGSYDIGESGQINFDTPILLGTHNISYSGGRNASSSFWVSGGDGFCYINCHSKNHTPKDYQQRTNNTIDCTLCHP